jgi:hypothetical protein
MEEIETTSTSGRTAEASDVELRITDTTRLVFRPRLVDNPNQPEACVRGTFVFERKTASGEWIADVGGATAAKTKAGELRRLELKSGELLKFMKTIRPLYGVVYQERGIPFGKQTYQRVDEGFGIFLKESRNDIEALMNAHPVDAKKALTNMVHWLVSGTTSDAVRRLAEIDTNTLPKVGALLGVSTLKAAMDYWEANRTNPEEPFWQKALTQYAFVLSQLFAQPVVMVENWAYVGGKGFDNTGGGYTDFVAKFAETGALAIIEIKTPVTPLLVKYRTGVYAPSGELTGAVAQVLKYRRTLTMSLPQLDHDSDERHIVGNPPCYVIIGDSSNLTRPMKESLELYRAELRHVRVVTYNELFLKTRSSIEILEGSL